MAGQADSSFATETAVKKSGEFICVRGTQKHANQLHAKGAPLVLFTDADGDEVHRATFTSVEALTGAMEAALKKYANQPIAWAGEPKIEAGSKKVLVVGFDDEKGEALAVLEDRSLVKLHARCAFVKRPYEKDGEAAKKWGVTGAPTLLLCDASKEAPEKNVLEKLTGKKSPFVLKAALLKALRKIEAGK
jgi:hypothetical protein